MLDAAQIGDIIVTVNPRPIIALILALAWTLSARAQTLTTVSVATGLTKPMQIAFANGDDTRLYVIEQRGIVKLIKNGVLQKKQLRKAFRIP